MEAAEKHEGTQLNANVRKIQRVGNSLYVLIPRDFVKRMDLHAGEEVIVASKGDTVHMVPVKEG
jgi:antitoxin component of MazEF toxin-antitoxin module